MRNTRLRRSLRGFTALALTVTVLATGCAQRTRVATQASMQPSATASRSAIQRDAAEWRRYLANLPIGTKLTFELADGIRLTGHIVSVEQDAVFVQPRTRQPSPARRVPFDTIVALGPESPGGLNAGNAIAIGAVAGAAAFMTFFLVIWALDD